MAGRRKPVARHKPSAGGMGCFGMLIVLLLFPLIVLLWLMSVGTAGVLGAAFQKPPRGD